ncbi:MAG: 50S ribosomal protein L4 [Micrococcaceae bacterium]
MATPLPEEIFNAKVSIPLIHQVVVAQQAAARQGTHKVKTRGERSGSGRKPFKQKGTGNARQGSVRMPQHIGGGIVHGPVPRSYAQRTPKKMVAAALRGALSDRAQNDLVHVVPSILTDSTPSTKTAVKAISGITQGKRALVVLDREDEVSMKSLRNVANVHVLFADQLNAYDVVVADDIIFTNAAMNAFVAQTKGEHKASSAKASADAQESAQTDSDTPDVSEVADTSAPIGQKDEN